jgi:DNA-binding transcriptional LysR family regulator
MELFQLRYFASAARRLSFSQAARDCHVAQPSLSLQIANLEREVGTALFVRTGRSVRLTDAGAALARYADRMLALEEEARRTVREVVGLEQGRLSVWTLPTPGQHLLPPLLARYRSQHPRIAITVHEAVPARAIGDAVASGSADLGIVHVATCDAPFPVPHLALRPLLTEELALVVPAGHALAGMTPALAELADEDFVWVPEGQGPEHPIFAACLAAGFSPHIACVSGSAVGMQALVAAGLGIALLPRLAIAAPPGSVVVELAPPRPTRTLGVIWRDDAPPSHAARAFLEMLDHG